ncbi:MAG: alpha/beta fold hydrolase [Chloroflexi bacterium]|nr:alpha/beta fold hydrolase [Chloroflexota bacterium]
MKHLWAVALILGMMALAACGDTTPDDASDYLALGAKQYTNDEYDEAIDSLSKAIELEPKYADAYFLRGISHLMKDDPDSALVDLDKALELLPNDTDSEITNAEIYGMRGVGHIFKEDYDKAIADSDRAIELDPTDARLKAIGAESYALRGYDYTEAKVYDRAIADLDRAFELDPDSEQVREIGATAYALRGYIHAQEDDYGRATADFNRAFELDSEDAQGKKAPETSAEKIDLFPCGGGVECGILDVPADYRDPEGGSITIAVNVRRADSPNERIGYLFVNPGGPGGSGLKFARDSEYVFADELVSRFDIVGFDPRGVGVSEPEFACGAPGERLALLGTIDGDIDTQDETAAGEAAANLCIESMGAVGGLLHSEYVARDMDEIRKALGAEQISYFGFSYGSTLGVWYATLFPNSVRAMVVDGADNPVDDANTQQERMEELSEEYAPLEENLKLALAACDSAECPIYNDGDPIGYYYRAAEKLHLVNDAAGGVPDAAFLGVVSTLYDETDWHSLWQGLYELQEEDDPTILLGYVMWQLDDDPTAANFTGHVNCLDSFALKPELDRATRLDDSAVFDVLSKERYPLIEASDFDFPSACPFYDQFAPEPLGVPLDGGGVPVLVIGNQTDPVTSFGESEEFVTELLSNGYLLETAHARHGVYPDNECVNEHVHRALVDGVYPSERRVFCERED